MQTEPGDLAPLPHFGLSEQIALKAEDVVQNKASAARELAAKHFRAEVGIQKIFRLTGSAEAELRAAEPIKLLEVNADTVPSGVLPISFGAAPASGILYPSVIVEVSPEEFTMIVETEELKLPQGWRLAEEFTRPQSVAGE